MSLRTITLHDSEALSNDPEIEAFLEQGIATPPAPRCRVCGHPMCPCCRTSCDHLVWFDSCGNPITDPNDPRELVDFQHCCGGRCVVDVEYVQAWCACIAELVSRAAGESRPLLQQHGPYLPARVVAERTTPEWGVSDLRAKDVPFTASFVGT